MPDDLPTEQPHGASGGDLPMQGNPDAFGAGVGQALEQGGEVSSKIHADAVQQFNQVRVMDAHNALQDFNQSALFDPKTGLLNQNTGAQAPGAAAKVLADHDAAVGKISDGLANDAQKIQFQRLADENRRTVQSHLDQYETHQVNSYADGVAQATVKNSATAASQNAILAANDPAATTPEARAAGINRSATQSIELGTAAITDNFRRQNPTAPANDPRLKEQLDTYQSAANYGVIKSLISHGQEDDASAYYQSNKDSLHGQEADDAARMIQVNNVYTRATKMVDQATKSDDGKIRDRYDVQAEFDKDPAISADPRLEAAVGRAMDRKYRAEDHAYEAHQTALLSSVQGSLMGNGGDIDAARRANPGAWEQMSPKAQEASQHMADAILKGTLAKDDQAIYTDFLIKQGSPEGRAAISAMTTDQLQALAPHVTEGHLKAMVDAKNSLATAGEAQNGPWTGTFAQIAKERMAKAKLPPEAVTRLPGSPVDTYNETSAKVLDAVGTQLNAWRVDNNQKNPPPEIINKAFDTALIQDKAGNLAVMSAPEGRIASVHQADPQRLQRVQDFIAKTRGPGGQPVTPADLVAAYNASLQPVQRAAPVLPSIQPPGTVFVRGHGYVVPPAADPASATPQKVFIRGRGWVSK